MRVDLLATGLVTAGFGALLLALGRMLHNATDAEPAVPEGVFVRTWLRLGSAGSFLVVGGVVTAIAGIALDP